MDVSFITEKITAQIESLQAAIFPAAITLYASIPTEYQPEKITAGAILFASAWYYIKHILPKNQEKYEKVCEENSELRDEITKLKVELAILTERTAIVTAPKQQEWGD